MTDEKRCPCGEIPTRGCKGPREVETVPAPEDIDW